MTWLLLLVLAMAAVVVVPLAIRALPRDIAGRVQSPGLGDRLLSADAAARFFTVSSAPILRLSAAGHKTARQPGVHRSGCRFPMARDDESRYAAAHRDVLLMKM